MSNESAISIALCSITYAESFEMRWAYRGNAVVQKHYKIVRKVQIVYKAFLEW